MAGRMPDNMQANDQANRAAANQLGIQKQRGPLLRLSDLLCPIWFDNAELQHVGKPAWRCCSALVWMMR